MSKHKGEGKSEPGSIQRDKNPERYGAGAEDRQGSGNQDQAPRDGAADSGVGAATTEAPGAASSGEAGGPNPGTAAPQDVVTDHELAHAKPVRDPIIDRDPGDEAFLKEHGAGGAVSDRTLDESPEFNQDRDAAIEGLHDGPGGRKYLVLNLTDDAEAQAAAGAYAEAIQTDPAKAELAANLFRIAGVNIGRRRVGSADTGRTT